MWGFSFDRPRTTPRGPESTKDSEIGSQKPAKRERSIAEQHSIPGNRGPLFAEFFATDRAYVVKLNDPPYVASVRERMKALAIGAKPRLSQHRQLPIM